MRIFFPLTAALLSVTLPAMAGHPGENLNKVMAEKEAAFEPAPARAAPKLNAKDGSGAVVDLADLAGKIVAVSFQPKGCGAPCTAQQTQLEQALASLNASPMREMVEFVTVGDTVPAAPAPADNWTYLQAKDATKNATNNGARDQSDDRQTAQSLADTFAAQSARPNETPMIHLLDRAGRQVGIFHGSDFQPLNLVLYINGLTNAHPHPEPGLFERLFERFTGPLVGRTAGWLT